MTPLCKAGDGATVGNSRAPLGGQLRADARRKTGTSPGRKLELRYPTGAAEQVNRRAAVPSTTLHRYMTIKKHADKREQKNCDLTLENVADAPRKAIPAGVLSGDEVQSRHSAALRR